MTEDKKYYTPTIEEFHVGLDHEKWNENQEKWIASIFTEENMFDSGYMYNFNIAETRIKFLDGEDIESFGWKAHENCKTESYWMKSNGRGYFMDVNVIEEGKIHIGTSLVDSIDPMLNPGLRHPRTLFCGKIKNKSELKTILRMVGVIK